MARESCPRCIAVAPRPMSTVTQGSAEAGEAEDVIPAVIDLETRSST